ncbi:MAG: UvrB/UvrC motif-containing protein, partial [Acidimicrobiia bacterium]
MANLVVEALQSVLPLRRCSTRLGAAYEPPDGAVACGAAQLGVAQCPCAGVADRAAYERAVGAAVRAFAGDAAAVTAHLIARMSELAAAQRFEEAAMVRDRLQALLGAVRRQRLTDAVRSLERCVVRRGDTAWIIDRGRLVDVTIDGAVGRALPAGPPEPPAAGRPLSRQTVDEALILAKFLDRHAARLDVVECHGTWTFPIAVTDE